MVKDTLGEGLAGGGSAQGAGETEGLNDGQVGLQVEDGGARPLRLLKDVAALLVEHRVDASQRLHRDEHSLSDQKLPEEALITACRRVETLCNWDVQHGRTGVSDARHHSCRKDGPRAMLNLVCKS